MSSREYLGIPLKLSEGRAMQLRLRASHDESLAIREDTGAQGEDEIRRGESNAEKEGSEMRDPKVDPMPGDVLRFRYAGELSKVSLLAFTAMGDFEYSVDGYPRQHPCTATRESVLRWAANAEVLEVAK